MASTSNVGLTYKTGQEVPVTGTYRFVRHTDSTNCWPTGYESHIPLHKGDAFPTCRGCQLGAFWTLEKDGK